MTAPSDNSLTISIVAYHSPLAELESTLSSLSAALAAYRDHFPGASTSVYLVDNSEDSDISARDFERLQELLQPAETQLTLIQGNGNLGYGGGHNLAINTSRAAYHLILNPDVTMSPDTLWQGVQVLANNAEVVAASPLANTLEGQRQYLCKRYPSVSLLLLRGFFPGLLRKRFQDRQADYEMHELSDQEPTVGVPIISGCFMLCKRSALSEAGGFDARYFLYFEDFDLSLRLGKLGQLAYVPAMKIVHAGGNTSGKGLRHILLFMRSGMRFFRQWGWRW